jgi:hypothetical protein
MDPVQKMGHKHLKTMLVSVPTAFFFFEEEYQQLLCECKQWARVPLQLLSSNGPGRQGTFATALKVTREILIFPEAAKVLFVQMNSLFRV